MAHIEKRVTTEGCPYYVNHITQETQWEHPFISACLQDLESYNEVNYAAYRLALKVQHLRKQLGFLHMSTALVSTALHESLPCVNGFDADNDTSLVGTSEVETMLEALYPSIFVSLPIAEWTDAVHSCLLYFFDRSHCGRVDARAICIFFSLLCDGKLRDKYSLLHSWLSYNYVVDHKMRTYLKRIVLSILRKLREDEPYKSSYDSHCALMTEEAFVRWLLLSEPRYMVWLPTLHRMLAAEDEQHNVKCVSCRIYPIVGLRYECLECYNLNLCFHCFATGVTHRKHKASHKVNEHCHASSRQHHSLVAACKLLKQRAVRFKKKHLSSTSQQNESRWETVTENLSVCHKGITADCDESVQHRKVALACEPDKVVRGISRHVSWSPDSSATVSERYYRSGQALSRQVSWSPASMRSYEHESFLPCRLSSTQWHSDAWADDQLSWYSAPAAAAPNQVGVEQTQQQVPMQYGGKSVSFAQERPEKPPRLHNLSALSSFDDGDDTEWKPLTSSSMLQKETSKEDDLIPCRMEPVQWTRHASSLVMRMDSLNNPDAEEIVAPNQRSRAPLRQVSWSPASERDRSYECRLENNHYDSRVQFESCLQANCSAINHPELGPGDEGFCHPVAVCSGRLPFLEDMDVHNSGDTRALAQTQWQMRHSDGRTSSIVVEVKPRTLLRQSALAEQHDDVEEGYAYSRSHSFGSNESQSGERSCHSDVQLAQPVAPTRTRSLLRKALASSALADTVLPTDVSSFSLEPDSAAAIGLVSEDLVCPLHCSDFSFVPPVTMEVKGVTTNCQHSSDEGSTLVSHAQQVYGLSAEASNPFKCPRADKGHLRAVQSLPSLLYCDPECWGFSAQRATVSQDCLLTSRNCLQDLALPSLGDLGRFKTRGRKGKPSDHASSSLLDVNSSLSLSTSEDGSSVYYSDGAGKSDFSLVSHESANKVQGQNYFTDSIMSAVRHLATAISPIIKKITDY